MSLNVPIFGKESRSRKGEQEEEERVKDSRNAVAKALAVFDPYFLLSSLLLLS
jgi:hypothetical protein